MGAGIEWIDDAAVDSAFDAIDALTNSALQQGMQQGMQQFATQAQHQRAPPPAACGGVADWGQQRTLEELQQRECEFGTLTHAGAQQCAPSLSSPASLVANWNQQQEQQQTQQQQQRAAILQQQKYAFQVVRMKN